MKPTDISTKASVIYPHLAFDAARARRGGNNPDSTQAAKKFPQLSAREQQNPRQWGMQRGLRMSPFTKSCSFRRFRARETITLRARLHAHFMPSTDMLLPSSQHVGNHCLQVVCRGLINKTVINLSTDKFCIHKLLEYHQHAFIVWWMLCNRLDRAHISREAVLI